MTRKLGIISSDLYVEVRVKRKLSRGERIWGAALVATLMLGALIGWRLSWAMTVTLAVGGRLFFDLRSRNELDRHLLFLSCAAGSWGLMLFLLIYDPVFVAMGFSPRPEPIYLGLVSVAVQTVSYLIAWWHYNRA